MPKLADLGEVIAVVCSDLHLSARPPVARAGEKDWFAAMERPLWQLRTLAEEYDCRVLCAGDVFDHWKAPPELINFALDALPAEMICIPGQHDLPNHSLGEVRRSAYQTLVKAGKIINATPAGVWVDHRPSMVGFWVHGFPWGVEVVPWPEEQRSAGTLHVALVHKYLWADAAGYVNAPKEGFVTSRKHPYPAYRSVVVGDNHQPWHLVYEGKAPGDVFNCGGFMRRGSDEVNRPNPRCGLLYSSGHIENFSFDTSKETFVSVESFEGHDNDLGGMETFIAELMKLQGATLDYVGALREMMDRRDVSPAVRALVVEALEHGRDIK